LEIAEVFTPISRATVAIGTPCSRLNSRPACRGGLPQPRYKVIPVPIVGYDLLFFYPSAYRMMQCAGEIESRFRLSLSLLYAFWAAAELNNAKPYSQIPSLGNTPEYLVLEQLRPLLALRP